jgi:hypothetical protein
VLVAALAASPAQARRAKPKPSEAERAFAALLRHGDLDQLAAACPRLLDQGYTIQLQQVQRRLLAIKPAPQPLAVVLANADALLTCQAPQAALRDRKSTRLNSSHQCGTLISRMPSSA